MSGIKNKLTSIVKYTKPLYWMYNKAGSIGVNILKLFVRTDDRLILFISYGGKKYDDSPRVIYEEMLRDGRFDGYRKIWAFGTPSAYPEIADEDKVKTDTLKYYRTALASRVWITNSSVERGLRFKGKNTYYFNTWHGTPIKRMGTDIASDNRSFRGSGMSGIDAITSQSEYETDIFSRVFNIKREKFLPYGLPRNDLLAGCADTVRAEYRKKLNIPDGKTAVLYMPTFREYETNANRECVLIPPIELLKWERELSDSFIFLFRAHYEVAKSMNITDNAFVRNVTSYPSLDELMIASDILISDYSSVFFDYSIMDKPMLHFTYDYDAYSKKRGMYFDIRDELDGADNEDGLIAILKKPDMAQQLFKTRRFREKYVNYYGSAARQSLEHIHGII